MQEDEGAQPPDDVESCALHGGAAEDGAALADMRELDDDVEALGVAWDALTQKARETVAELARACDAAVALVEEYRTPPRHCHELRTCWRRERDSLGPVLYVPGSAGSKKPCLRPTFLFTEVDARARPLEPRRRAQLIVCSERRVFDEQALRFYAENRTAGFSLTMILHTGGKVASEVTQQNILREPRGTGAGSSLAPRIEVHSHASIILHGTHAEESDFRIVPAAEAPRVRELYGIDDVASLPAVDATSREVMLTGRWRGTWCRPSSRRAWRWSSSRRWRMRGATTSTSASCASCMSNHSSCGGEKTSPAR